jgi:predicted Rdx family selenoprotein
VAAEVKRSVAVSSKLIAGKDGVFNVKVDGKVVFSKDKEYRFPEEGEVTRLLGPA